MSILFIAGTRPEALKLTPIIWECMRRGISYKLFTTGQHETIVESIFNNFDINIDYKGSMPVGNTTLSNLMSIFMDRIDSVLFETTKIFDVIVVQGDTVSTLAGALSGFYYNIPVAHVEAGLRADKYEPFPEEMHRRLISEIADFNFCPTHSNLINLVREEIPEENCYVTGNTIIDLVSQTSHINHYSSTLQKIHSYNGKKIVLATLHRRENWELIPAICRNLKESVKHYEDVQLMFVMHPNKTLQSFVRKEFEGMTNIEFFYPLDYLDFIYLMKSSYFIVTDSGGIQEEAAYLRKPVLVVRKQTERQEGVASGIAKLVDPASLSHNIYKLLFYPSYHEEMTSNDLIPEIYGKPGASQKIVTILGG